MDPETWELADKMKLMDSSRCAEQKLCEEN